jgi:hypothetical protein
MQYPGRYPQIIYVYLKTTAARHYKTNNLQYLPTENYEVTHASLLTTLITLLPIITVLTPHIDVNIEDRSIQATSTLTAYL